MPTTSKYFIAIILSGILINRLDGSPSSYEYEDPDDHDYRESDNDGDRLVGGKLAYTEEFPFMVGWNSYGTSRAFSCSGVLITPSYVLSAAHCNSFLISEDRDNTPAIREKCVTATKRGEYYEVKRPYSQTSIKIKCKWLHAEHSKDMALELMTIPQGLVYSGVDNIWENNAHMEERKIKRHIRHPYSYRGGATYGTFGGYDITLLEIDSPMTGIHRFACLPGPNFDDIRTGRHDSILSGYGRYYRDSGLTCQTNRHGPMKYHYCDKENGAAKGAEACKQGPPPTPPICKRFLAKHKIPEGVEEVKIKLKNGKSILCNKQTNPEKESYGWCVTKGNYYPRYDHDQDASGWGYCSRDCYLDQEEDAAVSGVLRRVNNVKILPEKECKQYLDDSIEGTVKVYPELLCVGWKNEWKEESWEQTPHGFEKLPKSQTPATRYGSSTYVASAGTCSGDSGGPVFVKDGYNHVVTGVVSGGRGPQGLCGGVNNPVHYARVRSFTMWLYHFMDEKSRALLCWDKKFHAKADVV